MMAFDYVFLDVARNESRAITTQDADGTAATFLFREFYCTEPRCNCRRVVLLVEWIEGRRVAASINYAFDPSKRRDEPQLFLDPLNSQSEHSEKLFRIFRQIVATDHDYVARLHRHYTMWRRVVDDPAHPDHRKVRGAAHDDPSFEPAFPRAAPKARVARSKGRASSSSPVLDLVVAKAARADSKLQQRFRKLLEKVDRLRGSVLEWKQQRPNIEREIASGAALFERQRRLGGELVTLLDRSHATANLTKTDRKKLATLISTIAADLLAPDSDDELKSIYNRHSRSDFDAEVAASDAAAAESLKEMLEALGMDVGDAELDSVEKIREFAQAQAAAAAEGHEQHRAKRKKSAKQLASEARRADENRKADKAVQEVYRALAMALHPDREQDPAERARKGELMREVNVAYEAKDLLRLLELQLQLERVDASKLETIAEERVRHYVRVLDEQSKQLAQELEELAMPFRIQMGLSPSARLVPAVVIAQLGEDLRDLQLNIASIERDLVDLADLGRLKARLKMQPGGSKRSDPFESGIFDY